MWQDGEKEAAENIMERICGCVCSGVCVYCGVSVFVVLWDVNLGLY